VNPNITTSPLGPKQVWSINDHSREYEFLNRLWHKRLTTRSIPPLTVSIIVVCHLIHDSLSLLRFLSTHFTLEAVIPKPKSINESVLRKVREMGIPVAHLDRSEISSYSIAIRKIIENRSNSKLLILDMGGYFSECLDLIARDLDGNLCGIIEDTENGLKRYQKLPSLSAPLYTVSDSSLKRSENILVGLAMLEGVEKVIERNAIVNPNATYGLIGFGRIGEEISHLLRRRKADFMVFDENPIKVIHARSLGYRVTTKRNLLALSDIILSVTGGQSLDDRNLRDIKNGAIIASITSSDDEFGFSECTYRSFEPYGHLLDRMKAGNQQIFLINGGNAVNFAVDPSIGASISILHGEIIVALWLLATSNADDADKINRVTQRDREEIASEWVEVFAAEVVDK